MIAAAPTPLFLPAFDRSLSTPARELRSELSWALVDSTSWSNKATAEIEAKLADGIVSASARGIRPAPATLERALAFAWAIPASVPSPAVEVEDDGEIAFDWDFGKRAVLSVSVGEGSDVSFASLIGTEPLHGTVAFTGAIHQTLAYLLRRITAAATRAATG